MVDFGVAIAWIAISAASVKGLTVFGRAAAVSCVEDDLAWPGGEDTLAHDGLPARAYAPFRRLGERS